MPAKEHYDFFKSQYEEENARYNELGKRAEIYLSMVSLFLTAVLFKIKDILDSIKGSNTTLITILLIAGLLSFSGALIFIINSFKIREYDGVSDFEDYIEKNNEAIQDIQEFYADRVAAYIDAVEINEEINNQKAGQLVAARYMLLAGFIITVTFIITLLIYKI